MLRAHRLLRLLVVAALLISGCQPIMMPAETEALVELPASERILLAPDEATEIETLIEQTMATNDIPGFAISIVEEGELAYAKGFGVVAKGSNTPVTPASLFQICSTSKTVVAMAIMHLVDQGLVGLDEPVTEYLPDFSMADDAYGEITIRHLLAHRAGVPDKGGDAVDLFATEAPRYDDAAIEEYVRDLAESPLLFTPGESYSYSSPGFSILGEVIAKVSGMRFEDYMKQNVLLPLGMEDSTFLFTEADPQLLTTPHMYDEASMAEALDFYPYDRRQGPSGGLYTSAADMSRLAMAHLNRGELDGVQVFPAWAYDEMWTPLSETGWAAFFGPTWDDYGLGWIFGEEGGHMVYNHTGANSGYQSHLLVVPDADLAIMTMVNVFDREEGSFHAFALGDQVMKILLDIEPEEAAEAAALDPAFVAEIEALVDQAMAENGIPGFAISVVKDGAVAYSAGFGTAELGADRPVTPQTIFAMASVSKMFTAAAVMQLVEQGKLDLGAPVTQYLPYFKLADPRYVDITIAQCMAHTAGFPMDPGRVYGFSEQTSDANTHEAYVRSLVDHVLLADPGGRETMYSNVGYNILADVIAKVSGESYEMYMARHIFEPLGMTHSTLLLDQVDRQLLATPHLPDESGETVIGSVIPYIPEYTPSAGLYANLEDMTTWAMLHLNYGKFADQRVLDAASYDSMWTPTSTMGWGGLLQDYGFGWLIAEADGHRLVWHLGTFPGYQASIILAPDDGLAVVTMDNYLPETEDMPWHASDIGNAVMLSLLGVEMPTE